MCELRTWEEAIKLKRSEKLRIMLNISMAILSIATGIIENNIAWVMNGLLWITISIIQYSGLKIQKGNDEIINLLEKHTKLQSAIIDALISETAVEVEINKIKIPKHFTKPNPKKLKQKFKYYRENNKFESPIIIDADYELVDGYTSYLIAKNYNKTSVIAKLKRKVKMEV